MTAAEWGQLAMIGNQAAMQWYMLETGKSLPVQAPSSVMGAIVGTDFGTGQQLPGQAPIGGGVIIVTLVAAAALVLILTQRR